MPNAKQAGDGKAEVGAGCVVQPEVKNRGIRLRPVFKLIEAGSSAVTGYDRPHEGDHHSVHKAALQCRPRNCLTGSQVCNLRILLPSTRHEVKLEQVDVCSTRGDVRSSSDDQCVGTCSPVQGVAAIASSNDIRAVPATQAVVRGIACDRVAAEPTHSVFNLRTDSDRNVGGRIAYRRKRTLVQIEDLVGEVPRGVKSVRPSSVPDCETGIQICAEIIWRARVRVEAIGRVAGAC